MMYAIYTYVYVYLYVYIYIHIHVCICICTYIYTYTYVQISYIIYTGSVPNSKSAKDTEKKEKPVYVFGSFTYGAKLWPSCLAVALGLVRDCV
jgi:hypothetical protein